MSEEIRPMTPTDEEAELARVTAAVVVLARHGISPDVQDVLLQGEPIRDIPPGALKALIASIRNDALEEAAKAVERIARARGWSGAKALGKLGIASATIRALKAKTQGE